MGGFSVVWSARGYWFVSELLCCYARCCRAEGLYPSEPAVFLSKREASGNCHKNTHTDIFCVCVWCVVVLVLGVLAARSLTITADSIKLCGTHLQICWAYFLAVCLAICPRSGGFFLRQAPPCPSLAPGNPKWCRVEALCYECTWIKLLCVVFLQSV